MVRTTKPTITVKPRQIAFWPNLCETEATKYLNRDETVTLLEEKFYYRPVFADKPYYHVNHNIYGEGYVLAEAF